MINDKGDSRGLHVLIIIINHCSDNYYMFASEGNESSIEMLEKWAVTFNSMDFNIWIQYRLLAF